MDDVKSLSHSKFRCKYQNLYSQAIEKGAVSVSYTHLKS